MPTKTDSNLIKQSALLVPSETRCFLVHLDYLSPMERSVNVTLLNWSIVDKF